MVQPVVRPQKRKFLQTYKQKGMRLCRMPKEKAYLIYTKLSCFVALKFHQNMANQENSKMYKDIEKWEAIHGIKGRDLIGLTSDEFYAKANERCSEK